VTSGALFCGFYSIIIAISGNYILAAIYILFAMILDGLDGRVARMTNTQTTFGEYFDSLSDMLCFGVAPALLIYLSSYLCLLQVTLLKYLILHALYI
jgi:CDP-diacylglycerol--serine O-phosphatidyltransferase